MKRGAFLLFGASAFAQQWKDCVRDKRTPLLCTEESKPAKNGECPVCGVQAKQNLGGIVRCKRCNAAFFRDRDGLENDMGR